MGLPVAAFVGVGANADLPFTVGDGTDVGDAAAAGRGATVVETWPAGCWVATTPTTTPTTTGWFGPLVDELVGTGWGSRPRTVAAGGWSGNGRKGEWILGPPSKGADQQTDVPDGRHNHDHASHAQPAQPAAGPVDEDRALLGWGWPVTCHDA